MTVHALADDARRAIGAARATADLDANDIIGSIGRTLSIREAAGRAWPEGRAAEQAWWRLHARCAVTGHDPYVLAGAACG